MSQREAVGPQWMGKQLVRFLVLKVTRWMRSEPSGMTTHISRIDLWSRLARVTVQYRFITRRGRCPVERLSVCMET